MNGDGYPDVVTANYGSNDVSVLLGNGDGSLRPPRAYAAATTNIFPTSVAVGDVNGDEIPDALVAGINVAAVNILLGREDGSLAPAVANDATSPPQSIAIADVNGDGKLDVAVSSLQIPTWAGAML